MRGWGRRPRLGRDAFYSRARLQRQTALPLFILRAVQAAALLLSGSEVFMRGGFLRALLFAPRLAATPLTSAIGNTASTYLLVAEGWRADCLPFLQSSVPAWERKASADFKAKVALETKENFNF